MAKTLCLEGGPGLILGQGTRSHMPQLRIHKLQVKISHLQRRSKIPCAATKTQHGQISKYFLIKK